MAIARDGGSSFPIVVTVNSTATATKNSGNFSTTTATTTLVCAVGWRGNANVAAPLTVAWKTSTPSGATAWALAKRAAITGTGANTICGEVWTASATSALTTVSVDVTKSGSTETDECASILVDALTGAGTTITNTGGNASNNGSAVNKFVALTSVASGSWLYFGYSGDGSTITAQSGTTISDQHDDSGGAGLHSACGYNSSGTSGTVNVGATGTQTFSAIAAIEVPVAGSSGTTYNESVTETATPSDVLATTVKFNSTLAETATASDTLATTQKMLATISETATAADSVDAGVIISVSLAETATPTDTLAFGLGLSASITESCSPTDVLATTQKMLATLAETAVTVDQLSNGAIAAAAPEEGRQWWIKLKIGPKKKIF